MIVGVPKETYPGEHRVALIPASVPSLQKAELEVMVESNAGADAGYPDSDFSEKGAKIASSRAQLFESADVVVQLRLLGANPDLGQADLTLLRQGQILVGMAEALSSPETD
jgi:NAD(P) transhydrogenase subunit alpha